MIGRSCRPMTACHGRLAVEGYFGDDQSPSRASQTYLLTKKYTHNTWQLTESSRIKTILSFKDFLGNAKNKESYSSKREAILQYVTNAGGSLNLASAIRLHFPQRTILLLFHLGAQNQKLYFHPFRIFSSRNVLLSILIFLVTSDKGPTYRSVITQLTNN